MVKQSNSSGRWCALATCASTLSLHCLHVFFFLLAQELVAAGGCVLLSLRPALRLTWQELGISKVEWTAHRMQKALNARRLDVQAKLNALAPLGASPRSLTEV